MTGMTGENHHHWYDKSTIAAPHKRTLPVPTSPKLKAES